MSLTVAKGSIHGIIGENGAGKSTLMSILYGFYEADSGEILVRGEPVESRNSHDAIESGIGMVHQHFMLIDSFTVLENVMLGAESGPLLSESTRAARTELERLEREYGLYVPLDETVGDLPVGHGQQPEIGGPHLRGRGDGTAGTDEVHRRLRARNTGGQHILDLQHTGLLPEPSQCLADPTGAE